MQLVGAPQAYIRGPFVMEGRAPGRASARCSRWSLLGAVFLAVRGALSDAAGGGDQPVVGPLSPARALRCCCCVGGMAVGCLGGLVAAGTDLIGYRILTRVLRPALHWMHLRRITLQRTCMPRFVTDSRPISAQHPITEFYREEFVKHHRCLQQQRPYYSESAITDVEAALTRDHGRARAALLARTTPTKWSAHSSRSSTS